MSFPDLSFDTLVAGLGLLMTGIGLIGSFIQLRLSRRQDLSGLLEEMETRFAEILTDLQEFRPIVADPKVDIEAYRQSNPAEYEDLIITMSRYFELCYRQWFRAKVMKFIPKKIWKTWDASISKGMTLPGHQQAWKIIRTERSYGGHAEFKTYMNQKL